MARIQHGGAARRVNSVVAPQTPGKILGQKLVLDLNSDLGVTGIGGTMQWADQGPLQNHFTQVTVANQPAYVANVSDGHAALRGVVATRKFLSRVGTFTGISPGDLPRYYGIYSFGAANALGGPFENGAGAVNASALPWQNGSGFLTSYYQNGSAGTTPFRTANITVAATFPKPPSLFDLQAVAGGNATMSMNNVAVATAANVGSGFFTDPLTSAVVVSRYNNNFDGDLFRVIIANPAPTAAEHNALITYLRSQYPSCNIAAPSLPASIVSPPSLQTILGSKLVLDLNADITLPGTGSGVLTWPDQSGKGNNVTQATAALQPTLVANVLNGHAAVQLSGTQYLEGLTFTGIAALDSPRLYSVASFAGAGSLNGVLLCLGSAATIDSGAKLQHYLTAMYAAGTRGGASRSIGAGGVPGAVGLSSVPALFDGRNDPAAVVLAVSGVDVASVVVAQVGLDAAINRVYVGVLEDKTSYLLTGQVFRTFVVNPPPTAAEHAAIIAYLRQQYPSVVIASTGLPTIQATPPVGPTLAQINGASLVLDLNSDVGVTTNGASAVSAWADSSGQNKAAGLAQPTASLQPLVVLNVMDGHAAIRFDGVDDCLENLLATIAGVPAGSLPYVYCVYTPRNATGLYSGNVFTFSSAALTEGHALNVFHYSDGVNGYMEFRAEAIVPYLTGELSLAPRVVTGRVLSGAVSLDMNNVQIATLTGTPGLSAMTCMRVGKRMDNAYPASMDLYRIVVVNPPPSAAQHAANMEYFRRTYPSAGLGDPYQAILGGLLVEKWDCRQNVYAPSGNVLAWKGTEKGWALQPQTAGQAPPLAVDTGYFNGIPVIQCAKTGSKCLVNQALPAPLFAAGTRPYLIVVARFRTQAAPSVLIDVRGSDYATQTYNLQASATSLLGNVDAASVPSAAFISTAPSAFALYETSAGAAVVARDGVVLQSTATGFSVITDQTKIGVGVQQDGGYGFSDTSIAMIIACSSCPTSTQLLALAQQLRTDFATADSYPSILGTNLAAMWEAQNGISNPSGISQWVDNVAGVILPAPAVGQRPPYGPDGTMFGGKNVVQTTVAGTKVLRGTALGTILPAITNSWPWVYTVGRHRTLVAAQNLTLIDPGSAGVSDDIDLYSTAAQKLTSFNTGVAVVTGPTTDYARHSYQQWLDGARSYLSIDNAAPLSTAFAASLGHNITAVGIGVTASTAGAQVGDASVAVLLMCFAKPTTAQITAVEALAAATYPGGDNAYEAILGSLLVEMWHSQMGIGLVGGAVDTWTGQIGGRVLTAPTSARRPLYQANGAFSSGKSMVTCVAASTSCLYGTGLTQLAAGATRPWIISVFRFDSLTGAIQMAAMMSDGGANAGPAYFENAAGTQIGGLNGSVLAFTNTTLAHTFENGVVGSTDYIGVDGTYGTVGSVGAINVARTAFCVGMNAGSVQPTNTSHALHIVCSAQPTAAQVASVVAQAKSEFGY